MDEDSETKTSSSVTELRTPTITQAADETADLVPPVQTTKQSDTPKTPKKKPADTQGVASLIAAANIEDASTTGRKRTLSPSKEREINDLKKKRWSIGTMRQGR